MEFFNRDILQPTPELLAMITHRRPPDRAVRRAQVGERGARPLLHAVARSVLRRDLRRLFRPGQPRLAAACSALRTRSSAPRRSWTSSIPRIARPPVTALSALTTGGHVIDFENRYRARDGSYKWLQWAAAPFPTQGLVYAAARDVTDRKSAEAALRVYARRDGARQDRSRNRTPNASRSWSRSSRWRARSPSGPPGPRASSSPT